MCKGGPALGLDRESRAQRWGVASDEEIQAAAREKDVIFLDTRTPAEVAAKPIALPNMKQCQVTMFSAKKLEEEAATLLPSKTSPIVVFCAIGGRADVARKALEKMGYTGTITNGGGLEDLQGAIPD